ncbi:MAG: sigma-54-dependent Fis family transcriptional regulator [Betaproteobacteria bacterium]|nr:sigma-54-dependent Fis family transcriptional regulator [Betaproteobacteria bacterium]
MILLAHNEALAIARRHLLDSGQVPAGYISPVLADSWQRSLASGLDSLTPAMDAPHASAPELVRARERQCELIDHALPAMNYLHGQTRDSGSVIVLSNAEGLLLQSCGDAEFLDRASQVLLSPGASWHEDHRGTNAVGTALALRTPTVITGAEHYLACNGFLTCAAAPISDSRGELLGVLDISGDYRSCHPHTFSLVRAAAQMIENRMFLSRHGGDVRLRFHPLAEGIGTLAEGVVAISHDGWVVGANPAGLALLSLVPADLGRVRIDQLLATRLEALIDWASRRAEAPCFLPRRTRAGLFVRVEMSQSPVSVSAPRQASVPVGPDALSQLDTGDEQMATAIHRARRIMGKDIPVLIQGESGVGKELFANAIHQSGPRRNRAFVAVNCAALPENLIEAELFGYVGGAYTGARREGVPGRIREANGGTLFLDEIGDMPLALQGRLLRVLQERVVQPLGGGPAVPVDFVLICATHCQLKDAVDASRFRADLYYRINGLTLMLPPLRERRDFNRLVASLLDEFEPARKAILAPSVAKAFSSYHWPGNLRQLANALRTACAMLGDRETRIDWEHLPDDLVADLKQRLAGITSTAQTDNLHSQADQTILRTVEAVQGNIAEAARRLGISRNTLYRRLQRMGR